MRLHKRIFNIQGDGTIFSLSINQDEKGKIETDGFSCLKAELTVFQIRELNGSESD
ncbi:MAG: hypothetical protein KAV87_14570 [Desulfobacteraceae bacterium]|nr:hypothetical protein [Desulfobacteraceae bacterium]